MLVGESVYIGVLVFLCWQESVSGVVGEYFCVEGECFYVGEGVYVDGILLQCSW